MEDANRPLSAAEAIDHFAPALAAAYRGLERGTEAARSFFKPEGSDEREFDPHLFSMQTRYETHAYLNEFRRMSRGRYKVRKLPLCGIEITTRGSTIRLFKATDDGQVPGAGRSHAKSEYFEQPRIPEIDRDGILIPRGRFAIVWDIAANLSLAQVSFACPKAAFRDWQSAECHWIQPIPEPTELLVPEPSFKSGVEESDDLDLALRRDRRKDGDNR